MPLPTTKLIPVYLLAHALLFLVSMSVFAQQMTPRAFWPAPKGTKLFVVGYSHTTGDVVVDPSLPIDGVDSRIDSGVLAYQQTLDIAGRTANLQLELPYVRGTTTGTLQGLPGRADVSGFGDVAATLSINLHGAPSMTAAEFQALRENPRPILGASIKVVAPTGDYDPDKLINVGTNRWAVRAQLGTIQPLTEKWLLELNVGTWFFQDNSEFLGETREQKPITAVDFSLIRRFSPGFWGSLDLSYYRGGRTTVRGIANADLQKNSRAGITFVFPIERRHLIKTGYSTGVTTEARGDYHAFVLSYVHIFN